MPEHVEFGPGAPVVLWSGEMVTLKHRYHSRPGAADRWPAVNSDGNLCEIHESAIRSRVVGTKPYLAVSRY